MNSAFHIPVFSVISMTKAKLRATSDTAPQITKVLLVDDHPIVRFGMRQLIEKESDLSVCGEADGANDAMGMISKLQPDLVVVDLSLNSGNGIDFIKQVKARGLPPKMLVASMHDESTYAERAIRAGAMGYINKNDAITDLVPAIRQVLADHIHLSPAMTGQMLGRAMGRTPDLTQDSVLNALSDRELEIFELMGRGMSAREIADNLYLSIKTVDTYRRHIKEKLKIATNSELTVFAATWKGDQ